jgi:hypothetical protein
MARESEDFNDPVGRFMEAVGSCVAIFLIAVGIDLAIDVMSAAAHWVSGEDRPVLAPAAASDRDV